MPAPLSTPWLPTVKAHFHRGLAFIGLSACAVVIQAQTTFFSNLTNDSDSAETVFDMQWFAGSFTTGANADGYALDHVDIAFTGVATDATFAISLWSDASDTPQANLGAFSHDTGIRFNPTDNLSVLPSTTYWLVLESNQISDLGSNYAWRTTEDSSFAVSGGWSVAGSFAQSTNQGATWAASPTDYLYAVTATPASAVPEPSTTAVILAGFALVGVVCTRRRARAKGVA